MNNSIVLALNAINKNRVDLGSHNIELNKLQDLYKKLTDNLLTSITNYEDKINLISKEKTALQKTFDKINSEQKKVYAEYDVKARELGLALNDIPDFKKMYDALLFVEDKYYKAIDKKL
jgi:hypothetical protein